jgi:hypothetical protein
MSAVMLVEKIGLRDDRGERRQTETETDAATAMPLLVEVFDCLFSRVTTLANLLVPKSHFSLSIMSM